MQGIRVLLAILLGAMLLKAQEPALSTDKAERQKEPITTAVASSSAVGIHLRAARPLGQLSRESPSAGSAKARVDRFTHESAHGVRLNLSLNSRIPAPTAGTFPWMSEPVAAPQAVPQRPKAISYTHGYEVRAKVHRYASYATLPIFVAQAAVGQKLFTETGSSGSLRSAHSALVAGTAILFGANSVTGVWNMLEARKDPNGKGRRLFHGILMLGADVGFLATGALAPEREEHSNVRNDRASTHRAVAFTSMGVATVSYLYMLFTR